MGVRAVSDAVSDIDSVLLIGFGGPTKPDEIMPFLGSSRLEEPINRYGAALVVHGHAHHGAPEGRTSTGVPVFNVALPVLKALFADQPPFRVFEIPVVEQPSIAAAAIRGRRATDAVAS